MSLEANKNLVRRFYEEIINDLRLDVIPEVVGEDYAEVMDGRRYEVGREGAKDHAVGVRQTYPDLHLTIDRQIAEGEWVVSCVTAKGTHSGEWMGIAPTGKPVTLTAVNVDRVVGGKMVEHGGAANMLAPFIEIGAVRVVGPDDASSL